MILYIFTILTGFLMYLLNFVWFRLKSRLVLPNYLLNGLLSGVVAALIIRFYYHEQRTVWIILPLIGLWGGLFLFLFARYNLYQIPFFQLFGTISLAIFTGLCSWILLQLLQIVPQFVLETPISPISLLLNMIIYSFLLHFGYAFTGRFIDRYSPSKRK